MYLVYALMIHFTQTIIKPLRISLILDIIIMFLTGHIIFFKYLFLCINTNLDLCLEYFRFFSNCIPIHFSAIKSQLYI